MDLSVRAFSRSLIVGVAILALVVPSLSLAGPTTFTSDDFNAQNLKRPLWTYTDPIGNAKVEATGVNTNDAVLLLTLQKGVAHTIYDGGYGVVRATQPCVNEDFIVEAKFQSGVSSTFYTSQGIIVEGTSNQAVAFAFTIGDASNFGVIATSTQNGYASYRNEFYVDNVASYSNSNLWLRVSRSGDDWTVSYSLNGTSFTAVGSTFTFALNVTDIGFYAENGGAEPPEQLTIIDYFFNKDAVINPEDGARNVQDIWSPLIHNANYEAASNAVRITWNSDERATSEVEYGYNPGAPWLDYYFNATLEIDHEAIITGLAGGQTYYFRPAGEDAVGPVHFDSAASFPVTLPPAIQDAASVSDDFNGAALNTGLWNFLNPRGDVAPSVADGKLLLPIPAGTEHNIWSNGKTAPAIEQSIGNVDFRIFAKFGQLPVGTATTYQIQGMTVAQDDSTLMTFNVLNTGATGVEITVYAFVGGLSSPFLLQQFTVPAPPPGGTIILNVERNGAQFKMFYSVDGGSSYKPAGGGFYHFITVNKVAVFAGNTAISGSSPPAFNCKIDYFWGALPAQAFTALPLNGALDVPLPVTVSWRPVSRATSYWVQLGTDPTFASGLILNEGSITDTTKAVPGLSTSVKYYWRVRGDGAVGSGEWSATANFTTGAPTPSVPVLVAPVNGAINQATTLQLKWQRTTPAANSYRVQVGTDSTFASGIVVDDSTVADTVKSISGLVNSTKYFWRVNAKLSGGGTSAFSTPWNFTTGVPVPALIAPPNNSTDLQTTVTLRWTRPSGATSFRLQLGTDPGFVSGIVVDDPSVTDTFRVVSSLAPATKFYWRVNADLVSGPTPYSDTWNFTTGITAPSQVILVSPTDNATLSSTNVTMTWQKGAPAVTVYQLDLAIDAAFQFTSTDTTITDTSKTMGAPLIENGKSYWWRVRAKNAAGWGPFSQVRTFQVVVTDVGETMTGVPETYFLGQNYPNPFNPSTNINFGLPVQSHVTLEVHNMIGERVATLVDEQRAAGYYTVKFNGDRLPSGVYFYRLSAGDQKFVRRMVFVK